MLINEERAKKMDPISKAIADMNGVSSVVQNPRTSVYIRGGFGNSDFLQPEYEAYPEGLVHQPYGVCDSIENLLGEEPVLEDSKREFVVTMTPVLRTNQEAEGGWRWHKWGMYIGYQDPQHEYLYDENEINLVYCYHIYEKV